MLQLLIALVFGLACAAAGFFGGWIGSGDRQRGWGGALVGGLTGLFIVPFIIRRVAGAYTNYLLYDSMQIAEVYLRRLGIWWALFGAGFVVTLITLLFNIAVAATIIPGKVEWPYRLGIGLGAAIVAGIFGALAGGIWDEILLYLNQVPFGKVDPLFGRDIGWYVFSYPFLKRMVGWGFGLLIVNGIAACAVYLGQTYSSGWGEDRIERAMVRHVGILAFFLCLLLAAYWSLRQAALPINSWSFLGYASEKIAGAGWVDNHYTSGALAVLPWFSVAIGIGCLIAAFRRKWSTLAWAGGLKLAYIVVALWIIPMLVWAISVRPNELTQENPYIGWSNQYTLEAYDLGEDNLTIENFPARELTAEDIAEVPPEIFDSLRLLDPFQVFLPNVDGYAEHRSYYDFLDPDIGLYQYPNGSWQQVMLAARELPEEQIPNRTWVNEHLVFTHGRGAAMAGTNTFDRDGNMDYLTRLIPGEGPFVPEQEAFYYGEDCEQWVATSTTEKEVGPPTPDGGWEEVEYNGSGGVLLGSGLRRLAFAIRFNDLTLLITNRVLPESRIHYARTIQERVSDVAPWFWLDDDPYFVAVEENFVWMWDAATWARNYPYADSSPVEGLGLLGADLHYVRPSVKITMGAYDGMPHFYVVDPDDPVVRTWQKIFPTLFEDLSDMPEELQAHIRYPEQVFILQTQILRRHHMRDARTLYNEEDLWEIAAENFRGEVQITAPRYVLTILPGKDELEYILDWSYTRVDKENAVAFIAARSQPDHYGEVLVYRYPVGQTILGPALMESIIDQDRNLAGELTLISQQGKEVVRGNLMALPLGNTIIYVKPLYVRSTAEGEEGGLPQLRYVVVGSTERRIAYGNNLKEALEAFVRGEGAVVTPTEPAPTGEEVPTETLGECEQLWQELEAATNARNEDEAARIAVEIVIKCGE